MLVVYSSILKKDNFLRRFAEDASSASIVANDLTCNLKSLSVTSADGKLDWSLQELEQAENNLKELTALLNNLKQNLQGYVGSLVPKQEQAEEIAQQPEEKVTSITPAVNDERQITDILAAIKSLKEMKDSLNEK